MVSIGILHFPTLTLWSLFAFLVAKTQENASVAAAEEISTMFISLSISLTKAASDNAAAVTRKPQSLSIQFPDFARAAFIISRPITLNAES
jgi:hypothetical protein